MTEAPNVSVIVAAYNAEETIEHCIESLLKLSYPREKRELIFIDNASTDGTATILRKYGDGIHVSYERKRGPAAARNRGLSIARGDIVAFTDSDCVVDEDWLRNIISPLKIPIVGIVGGRILSRRPYNEIEKFGESIHDHNKAINVYKPPYAITMNWSSRLSVLKEVGFFDEDFIRGSDVDLSYRLLQARYRFLFEPDAIVYHRNESTLWGLFKEGIVHGYYSLPILKKHRLFLKSFKHRRINPRDYIPIGSSLLDFLRGRDPHHSICSFMFTSAKKIGKIAGSIRFLDCDL